MLRKKGRTTTSTPGGAGMASAQIGRCSECVQSVPRVSSECVQSVFRVCSECVWCVFRVASAQIGRCAGSGIGDECFFCIGGVHGDEY